MLLSDTHFLKHCQTTGNPFPVSLSGLRKDRIDGRYGLPYTRIGGLCFYDPVLMQAWIDGQPVIQPQRHPALAVLKPVAGRRGRPSKTESVNASRRGLTVPELRAAS